MMNRVFEKVRIHDMELKNRIIMSAMVTHFSTEAGEVTDRLIAYHRQKAIGGVGMIETEAASIHPSGKGSMRQLGIYKDALIPGLKRLVTTVHENGAKMAIQL